MEPFTRAALFALTAIVAASRPSTAAPEAKPMFVGVKACASCHKSQGTGNQFEVWNARSRAHAFAALASDRAYRIAKRLRLADEPQRAAQCLSCRTTGAGEPGKRFDVDFDFTQGVQSGSCHGAGGDYGKIEDMIARSRRSASWTRTPGCAHVATTAGARLSRPSTTPAPRARSATRWRPSEARSPARARHNPEAQPPACLRSGRMTRNPITEAMRLARTWRSMGLAV